LSDIFLTSDSVHQLFAGRHRYDSVPLQRWVVTQA